MPSLSENQNQNQNVIIRVISIFPNKINHFFK